MRRTVCTVGTESAARTTRAVAAPPSARSHAISTSDPGSPPMRSTASSKVVASVSTPSTATMRSSIRIPARNAGDPGSGQSTSTKPPGPSETETPMPV